MRFIAFCIMFFLAISLKTYAQQDTAASQTGDTSVNSQQKQHLPFLDSVAQAMQMQQQAAQDSMTSVYIRPADPLRED